MAYHDPYANSSSRQSNPAYTEDRPFDTYGTGGQGYVSSDPAHQRQSSYPSQYGGGYYDDDKLPPAPPRGTGMLQRWRKQDRGKVLMRGGGLRFFGRCFCCTLMFAFVLIVGVVFTLALFIKPPNLTVNSFDVGNAGYNGSSLTADLNLSVTVTNPSYFTIGLRDFEAKAYWPGVSQELGSSNIDDIDFGSNSKTTFPVAIGFAYTPSSNTTTILTTIVEKCGLLSTADEGDLTIDYTVNMGVRILGITVHPKIAKSASFACPFDASDLKSIAESVLGSSSGLSSSLTSILGSLTG